MYCTWFGRCPAPKKTEEDRRRGGLKHSCYQGITRRVILKSAMRSLQEVDRVLKDEGIIWIAIPNGYSLDDRLYRLVFSGGGHVNRFARKELIKEVHALTRFRLMQEVDLFSSFIYLQKPTLEKYQYYPRRARPLFYIPDTLSIVGILVINTMTRLIDKLLGCRTSQYGWGFVFARKSTRLPPLHRAYFNVCSKCGSGLAATQIREAGKLKQCFGVGLYRCLNCHYVNAFVSPPAGLH